MGDSRTGGRAGFGGVLRGIPLIGRRGQVPPMTDSKAVIFPARRNTGSRLPARRHLRGRIVQPPGSVQGRILNDFVAQHRVQSVIELGCGDGHQLSLAKYPRYIGLDVSPTAVECCKARFNGDTTKQFYVTGSTLPSADQAAELALSLDVIYHLVEDAVFTRTCATLFTSGPDATSSATRAIAIRPAMPAMCVIAVLRNG